MIVHANIKQEPEKTPEERIEQLERELSMMHDFVCRMAEIMISRGITSWDELQSEEVSE